MIYLINTTYYDKETATVIDLLKIGYSQDNSWERRLMHYKLHNPLCEVVLTIPEATEEQEHKLHYKFRDLRYSDHGREWFTFDQEYYHHSRGGKEEEEKGGRLEGSKNLTDEGEREARRTERPRQRS